MRTAITIFLLSLLSLITANAHLSAEDHALAVNLAEIPTNGNPIITASPTIKPDGVRVAVLGYHVFSNTRKVGDMIIRTSKFRKQMQAIKDLKLNVISLEDFILWKQGKKEIKDHSILITIDDGWKSVYTDAYPILKEFGYPFAIYLYTDYIDRGGRSLTKAQIKEMMAHGCSIGSHSVTHPLPSKVKKMQRLGAEPFEKYLHKEFGTSQKILKKTFPGAAVNTYVYPGGYHDHIMYPISDHYGYQALFTCRPGKTTRETDSHIIPRYIILGQDKFDYIFKHATTFKATASSLASAGAISHKTPYPVSPQPGNKVADRTPTLSADLSAVENLDPESLIMRVSGFGRVPATFNSTTKTISWKVNRPLRCLTCTATLQWKLKGQNKYLPPMTWTFIIDKEAAYIPKTAPFEP